MADSEEKKKMTFPLSEGIFLAITSAFAYLLTFYYEKGYASYFGITEQFISIDLINVLIFASMVLIAFTIFFIFIDFLVTIFWGTNLTILVSMSGTISLLICVAILIILFGFKGFKYWYPFLIVLVICSFVYIVLPLIKHRDKKRYIDKLEAQQEIDRKFKGIFDTIPDRYRLGICLTVFLLAFGIIIAEEAGKAKAFKQSKFLVTNTSQEMVVLRIYRDNLICVPFDRKTHEVKKKFTFIKVADDPNLSLNLEKVGPLHPDEP